MPQLSPMSWVMVIGVFLVCLIFFAVTTWWLVDGKYHVEPMKSTDSAVLGKNFVKVEFVEYGKKKTMKWGFGKLY